MCARLGRRVEHCAKTAFIFAFGANVSPQDFLNTSVGKRLRWREEVDAEQHYELSRETFDW